MQIANGLGKTGLHTLMASVSVVHGMQKCHLENVEINMRTTVLGTLRKNIIIVGTECIPKPNMNMNVIGLKKFPRMQDCHTFSSSDH